MLTLYFNGLLGLQKHVTLNCIIIAAVIVRSVGAVLVLWLIEPSTEAFFIWVAIVSFVQLIVLRIYLVYLLPDAGKLKGEIFKQNLKVWKFAAGMTGISFMAFILTQLDKIVLSKMLTLEMFGFYSIAWVVASGLYYISNPFYSTLFPKFSQLVKVGDSQSEVDLYHKSSQTLAVILIPIAMFIVFYSFEILELWTNDSQIAENVNYILKLLTIGAVLNALLHVPYALQFAHGWTNLALILNAVGVILIFPFLIMAVNAYSSIGAAMTWAFANLFLLLAGMFLMHKRILKNELKFWCIVDNGMPIMVTLCVLGVSRLLFDKANYFLASEKYLLFMYMAIILLITIFMAILSVPYTRQHVVSCLNNHAFIKDKL